MRLYTIHYKNGKSEEVEVADRSDLVATCFDGSEEKLKSEVDFLYWATSHMTFTEKPSTGEVTSQILSADQNLFTAPGMEKNKQFR